MKKIIVLLLLSMGLSACYPEMKIAKIDPSSGLIQSKEVKIGTARVTKNVPTPLKDYKEFVFVSSALWKNDFAPGQVKEIGYFDKVVNHSDLETMVIEQKLQDKIISLNSQIGLSRLANNYKPFLWIRVYTEYSQATDTSVAKLVVTRAENAQEVFEAQADIKSGSSDETVWYPIFNALISWINQNK